MKKDEQKITGKKTTNTKNMDLSYILRTAVGNKEMQNLADYDIEIIASDADLAGKLDSRFNEVGANNVKTSYLEPINPIAPKDYRNYRAPVRQAVQFSAPVQTTSVETAPEETASVETVPVEEEAVEETPETEAE